MEELHYRHALFFYLASNDQMAGRGREDGQTHWR